MIGHLLKLIRWPNLLLLALLQLSIRYALAAPFLESADQGFLLTDVEFLILVGSCILIAAGGYVINDIEDIHADRFNSPTQSTTVEHFGKDRAFNLYLVLTFTGLIGGLYLEYIKGYAYIGVLQLICTGLLYFYSTSYQCIPLLGNLIIALLSALSAIIVILPEPLVKSNPGIMLFMEVLIAFVFVGSFVRELVKDCEDEAGDSAAGCGTLAVQYGTKPGTLLSVLLLSLLCAVLVWIQVLTYQWEHPLPFGYLLFCIELPLIFASYSLLKAKKPSDFHKVSQILKFIMFAGVLSMVVFGIDIA
jgi:4-hydroxybenzoate polyprenyltransferase